jgi:hypothetical protein
VQSDLVNYKNYTQNVYLTWDYEYVPGFVGINAITTLLSVTGEFVGLVVWGADACRVLVDSSAED